MPDSLERVLVPTGHLREGFPSFIAGVEGFPAIAGGLRIKIPWREREVKSHQDGVWNRPKCQCGVKLPKEYITQIHFRV